MAFVLTGTPATLKNCVKATVHDPVGLQFVLDTRGRQLELHMARVSTELKYPFERVSPLPGVGVLGTPKQLLLPALKVSTAGNPEMGMGPRVSWTWY